MREAFGEALIELGKRDERLLVLDADVSSSTKTGYFAREFPDRFFNMGVAEANLAGTAAGMATCGYRPLISAFAIFLALKSTDQIRNVICYNNLPVIVAGGYAGLSDSYDGASHQSLTDIAIMRSFPEMSVLVPSEDKDILPLLTQALNHDGPVYLRLCRNPLPEIPLRPPLEWGKASLLRKGNDITLCGCGKTLAILMEGAETLSREGIDADVLDLGSVKPLDKEAILASVKKTGACLILEEHSVHGGVGSAVAEFLVVENPVNMRILGVKDCFTESGPYDSLLKKYGISVESLVRESKQLISSL